MQDSSALLARAQTEHQQMQLSLDAMRGALKKAQDTSSAKSIVDARSITELVGILEGASCPLFTAILRKSCLVIQMTILFGKLNESSAGH